MGDGMQPLLPAKVSYYLWPTQRTRQCYISNCWKRNKFKYLVCFISIFHIFPVFYCFRLWLLSVIILPPFLSIWLRITIDLTNLFFFSLMWQSQAHRSWRKNWNGLLSWSDSYISLYTGIQFRRLSKTDVCQWWLGFCSTAMQRWLLIPFPKQRLWCIRPIYSNRHFFLLKLIFSRWCLIVLYFYFIHKKKFDGFLVMQNLLCCVNTLLQVIDNIFFSSLASCVPLQAPGDGKIQNNDIKHGALVSFSCNDGFQTNGSRILKCINGKWNGSAPTCKGLRNFPPSFVFIPLIWLVCTVSSSSSFFLVSNKLIK